MSSEKYSSSQPRSDAQASASSALPPTPPSPQAPESHLTPAELAQSSVSGDVQYVSAPGDRTSNQRELSESNSPPWEEADEERDDQVESLYTDRVDDARICDDGGSISASECKSASQRSAASEPMDAPLVSTAWQLAPLPSSSSSSLSSSTSSPAPVWREEQRTGGKGLGQVDVGIHAKSEHPRCEGEGLPIDAKSAQQCPDTVGDEQATNFYLANPSAATTVSDASEGVDECSGWQLKAVHGDTVDKENVQEEERWRSEANSSENDAVEARAASITSEVLAESVWASEERASAALQQFSTALHSKLVEQLIDEAAVAVRRTLQDTTQQHESRVRTLMAHNRLLGRQLSDQAEQMQSMRRDLEESVVRDLQRVLRLDFRQVLRSASMGSHDSEEVAAELPAPRSAATSRNPSSGDEHRLGAEEDAEAGTAAPTVDELIAAYLHQRGALELLHKERAHWRENMAVLGDRLLAATRENVQLRQEVERLQTTTVDLSEHRAVLKAKEEAEHECALMQLQVEKHIEEAEMMAALVERHESAQLQPPIAADVNTTQMTPTSGAAAGASAIDESGLPKGRMWNMALRELEEQATLAANSHPLREQLANAEAQLQSLQKDRDASVAYAAELREEGDVLRADLQSMVYRNGVLSQQVASLLVKVERICRENRQLKGHPNRYSAKDKWSSGTSTPSSTLSTTSAVSSDARLTTLPSRSARRSAWLNAMWPSSTSRVAARPQDQKRPNTAVPGSGQQQPYSSMTSTTASQITSLIEVEEGVHQRLRTYAASHLVAPQLNSVAAQQPSRQQRHVSLRQLGSNVIKVDRVCNPHLPASDHLSGCALGRPSSFSIVDNACGTVSRQVGTEEVTAHLPQPLALSKDSSPSPATLADRGGGDRELPAVAEEASPSMCRMHSVDDGSNDLSLLHLLDTLDKDENLDRFSINSVSELMLRNQELVKQLYEVTQRADAAEEALKCLPAPRRVEATPSSEDVATPSLHYACARRSDGADVKLDVLPATLTTSTTALLRQGSQQNSHKRNRERDDRDDDNSETGDAEGTSQGSDDTDNRTASQPGARGNSGMYSTPTAGVESWVTKDASDAVASMVDAIVCRRDVQLTSADTEVSRALLKALEAQRATDNAVQQIRTDDSEVAGVDPMIDSVSETERSASNVSLRAMSACLRSLLQLCVRQSAALADVALTAADHHEEIQTAVKNTWTEVQQTLLAALNTSNVGLLPCTSASPNDRATRTDWPPYQRVRREGGAVESDDDCPRTDDSHQFRPEEQVAILHQLRTLLHTAAKKDETLLHVYQAAQARKDARHRQEKERVTRLLLKLERKRRIIKALQLRNSTMSMVAAVGTDSVACGPSHASPLDGEDKQSSVAAGLYASPHSISPLRRTPPIPPMVLPASSSAAADKEHRGDGAAGRASSIDSGSNRPHRNQQHHHRDDEDVDVVDADSEEELDDETLTLDIFRDLQQQLALSQASYRAAQEELDAEKAKHASLLERMWVLEAARDDSAAAAKRVEMRMNEMLTREQYQAAVAELEGAAASLMERDAELREAKTAHRESQEQVEELKQQLEMQRQDTKQQYGELENVLRMREQRLLSEETRSRKLHEQLTYVKEYAESLEKSIARARSEARDHEDVIRHQDATIEELKAQILMRNDVQELLCRLYPDNSVLNANAQLIRRLSDTSTRLQLELDETQQDLAHVRGELQRRDLDVREARQERQAAEVRLQDALTRLEALRDIDGGSIDAEQLDTNESSALRGTTTPQTADPASRMATLFNVDEAPLAALRQRVRYLNACVDAQAEDIAILRAAESSWKRREVDLRKQLEVMSADPVSLTARRYGLSNCVSFEEQIGEMQDRQSALEKTVAQLQKEKDAVAATIEEHAKAAAVAHATADAAQATVERITAQLASIKEKCATQSLAAKQMEKAREEDESKRVEVERRCAQMLSDLADTKESLSAAQESLKTAVGQRDHFWKDNNLLISKVEELEKALLQADAEKRSAQEALAQGLSVSRRRRGGGDSSAADRYRGQASLTQDLSIFSPSSNPL